MLVALLICTASVVGVNRAGADAAGTITLVSHTPVGPTTAPIGESRDPVTSADGAYVVFTSTATNLVANQSDVNNGSDIFLFQRATGMLTLVSHAAVPLPPRPTPPPPPSTTTANGESSRPSISSDGSFVAFESTAKNLVADQTDPKGAAGSDVFVYSRATGTTSLVSHVPTSATSAGNDSAHNPSISADGAYVAFDSYATTLVTGQSDPVNTNDVFLYRRADATVTLVSHTSASATTTGSAESSSPRISADGAFVAFPSSASNLVAGQSDANGGGDVFLYSRATGAVTLVSHTPASASSTGNGPSHSPSISADGALVAFISYATNMVASQSDANGFADAFLYSRATGAVTLVSRTPASATTTANNESVLPSISADGAFVAFISYATNMVASQSDTHGFPDVFLYSRGSGAVTLVSHTAASAATTGNHASDSPSISADGGFVAFASHASNLVAGQSDANTHGDVFLYSRATGAATLVSHTPASATTTGNHVSQLPAISADGAFVAFQSLATNLVEGQSDANGAFDVFRYSRTGGSNARRSSGDFDGDGDSDIGVFRPSTSTWFVQSGVTTAFGTSGDIPVPGNYDGDGDSDVAVFRPSNGYWFVQGGATVQFGANGDIPVPADYDGNGTTDIAVFRPSNGYWFVRNGPTVQFGASGDIPVPGDYNGNGTDDIAVFRPSNGYWYVNGGAITQYGASGDIPVPADYNGNGTTDIAVFRPSNGYWFVQGGAVAQFGTSGDIPVPGDYDGNGSASFGVFRPSTGTWFVPGGPTVVFGTSGDRPLPLPSAIRQAFFP